jgi:hypothetical protein
MEASIGINIAKEHCTYLDGSGSKESPERLLPHHGYDIMQQDYEKCNPN